MTEQASSVFNNTNPWATTPDAELPLFNEASAVVAGMLFVQRACLIVAPLNTGKSVLLSETQGKVEKVTGAPTRLFDAGQLVSSAEVIDDSREEMAIFSDNTGPEGFLFLDNIGRYSTLVADPENNRARLRMIEFFTNLLDDPESAHFCAATRGLEPQARSTSKDFIDLRAEFTDDQRYDFSGRVERTVAQRMLAVTFGQEQINAIIDSVKADQLTYSLVKTELERKASEELSLEFEAGNDTANDWRADAAKVHKNYRKHYPDSQF